MTANEPSTPPRELYRLVLSDLRRHWRPLLVTDLVFKLVAFALLTPLVGLALKAGVFLSGRPVLADMEIVGFLLRPVGLAVLLLIAALSLALVALEQASLLALAAGAAASRRVSAVQALRWAAQRAFPVLRLAVRLVARCLLLAAPFLAALALVYFLLLREFDINYYLKERPAAFWLAAGLGGLLLLGLLRLLVPRVVGWFLALPILLFEGVSPRTVLAESETRSAGSRATVVRALLLWAGGALLLSSLLPPLFLALGRLLVPYGRGNAGLVLALMLLLVLLWAAANVLVTWVNASSFALLLVRTYERHGGGRRELVAALAPGHELEVAARTGLTLPRLLAGLAALALAAGLFGAVLLRGVRANDQVLVIAHRGAAAYAPENTLASVRTALEQGADFVEIDVQETADGELAVVHDSDFMKVAGVDTKVWNATSEQLAAIDVGSRFAPGFAGERVPRLRDVLETARGRAKVMIELKYYGHDVDLERRVVAQVEELGVAGEIVVMSLESAALGKMRALRPGWTVGLLTAKAVGDLTELDADFLAVNAGIATRSFVRRAHAKGKQVYVWTVNDPVRMFQMINLGVDGIITDRPDLARSVLERRRRLSSVERLLVGLAFFFGAGADDRPVADDAG